MLVKVQRKLEKLGIGQSNKKDLLIAAVSGGADSVFLLLVLKELKERMDFDLEAIHVEHGIRGEESRGDALFVEELCEKLSVPCHVASVDVPAYSKKQGLGMEEAARTLRYTAFSEYASSKNGKVVLAHHMDDNAETVLFQMLRGSSLKGMCGISDCRYDENGVMYLRPLLDIQRSEIEAYLKAIGQDYCIDSTNEEMEYRRNYLRKEVVPRLKEINSAAVPHISQTAARLEEIRDFLQLETQKAMADLCHTEMGVTVLGCRGLRELHPALQKEVVYETIARAAESKKDITSTHVEEVLALLESQSGKRVVLPYKLVVSREFDALVFSKEWKRQEENRYICITGEMLKAWKEHLETEEINLPEGSGTLKIRFFTYEDSMKEIPKNQYTKWMDYDKIEQGFCIRTRENGDFFINDVNGHRKKLQNYFVDEKIPLEKRNTMWLLAQDNLVMWLIGGRISEHVKVTDETKTVMEIQYIGGN